MKIKEVLTPTPIDIPINVENIGVSLKLDPSEEKALSNCVNHYEDIRIKRSS